MTRKRVLIVEDSAVIRQLLEAIVAADPRLEVAGSVASGEEAVKLVPTLKPDVISMDIRLPGMDGFETTQRILRDHPTPIVVCAGSVQSEDLKISMNALRAGALAVVEKPVGVKHADYVAISQRLCTQLAIMSEVKVVRQRPFQKLNVGLPPPASPRTLTTRNRVTVLGLVASTGGPNALGVVLKDLPRHFPVPVLLVQHMVPQFLDGFVEWLNTLGPLPAKYAKDGDIPVRGNIYLPPADYHLALEGNRMRLDKRPPVSFQRPSGTVLFQSLAKSVGRNGLGVLLTGMGDDGAEGLAEMKRAGAHTIAEAESSAVVYGMPKTAVALNAVTESLDLSVIASRIVELVMPSARTAAAAV